MKKRIIMEYGLTQEIPNSVWVDLGENFINDKKRWKNWLKMIKSFHRQFPDRVLVIPFYFELAELLQKKRIRYWLVFNTNREVLQKRYGSDFVKTMLSLVKIISISNFTYDYKIVANELNGEQILERIF